jgi:DNA polymerase-3 subunit epsilon
MRAEEFSNDYQQAAKWAHDLLKKDFVILDSETTGLGSDAEICELAIIDSTGRPLLSTLVKPQNSIPPDAIAIHGITNQMVQRSPVFAEIYSTIQRLVHDRLVVIYNAGYDKRILEQCCRFSVLPNLTFPYDCAMNFYSQWVGEWSDYHGNYRWQKLPGGDHTALGDCLATLNVIQKMAETCTPQIGTTEVTVTPQISKTADPIPAPPGIDELPF